MDTYNTSASQSASTMLYLFSTIPLLSKPKVPVIVYRYLDTTSMMGTSCMYSIHNNLELPSGAFTYNSSDTLTVTVHQYSYKTFDGKIAFKYIIGKENMDLGDGFIYDYPVFNVYTSPAAERAPIYYQLSTVGSAVVMSSESFIPDVVISGPDDIVFKLLQNNANNLCLSASSTGTKPSQKTCDQTNGEQVRRFIQNQFGRSLTNTLTKLIVSESYTTAAFNYCQYTSSGLSAKCIYTDSNGYHYDLSPLSSSLYNISLGSTYDTDNNNYRMYFSTDKSSGFVLGGVMDANEIFGPSTIYSSNINGHDGISLTASGTSVSVGLKIFSGSLKLLVDYSKVWESTPKLDGVNGPFKATIQSDGNFCIYQIGQTTGTYCTYTHGLGGTMISLLQAGAYGRKWGVVITNPAGKMVWGRFGESLSNSISLIPGRDYLYVSQLNQSIVTITYSSGNPKSLVVSTTITQWSQSVQIPIGYFNVGLQVNSKGACVYASISSVSTRTIFGCLDGTNGANDYPTMRYLQLAPPGRNEENPGENSVVYRTTTIAIYLFFLINYYNDYNQREESNTRDNINN
ncbi:hypothetical protein DFA_10408 [Cavenderia fasciculata]|uniref:Uncharacterized protein n=1 Tax=Cavenderia fasciculata TaxID=261658 RepID=F4QA47_CACFS|nr:uncharacterized protein DFA_10408 [Cavenderia fasciculata]EGG15566.1 hypothetical protein DFA_10408 [Cavenderia fasciculata]|eukprot:XP_004354308.1 hypothetical protein DFA_10408 [Cavenderia fasciculata]